MPNPDDRPPPPAPKRAATSASTTTQSQLPELAPSAPTTRHRIRAPTRKTSAQSLSSAHSPSPAPTQPRRSSTFSLSSIDELSQSLTSDLLNPSLRSSSPNDDDEDGAVTNWHSTPLLFALLPAVGGVLFKEGAAVVTDLLILGLAAVFLNWSVRLPWDWYYGAQGVVREAVEREEVGLDEDDEGGEEAVAEEEGSGDGKEGEEREKESAMASSAKHDRTGALEERREQAMAGLRTQETLALLSTFLFPALAAYLLHVLRFQLSKPSTGLVSDYNLSVFLLVAEIRPCRQLIRLTRKRTLHLQRTVADPPGSFTRPNGTDKSALSDMTARLSALEQRFQTQPSPQDLLGNGHLNPKSAELDDLKKRYDSRLDALERAVRRYEKRTTTLALVTEQRLKAIDARLSDTLSLAAVAAQESQRRGVAARTADVMMKGVMLPVQLLMMMVMLPVKVIEDAYARLKGLLFGTPRRSPKSGKRSPGAGGVRDEKGREKTFSRKAELAR